MRIWHHAVATAVVMLWPLTVAAQPLKHQQGKLSWALHQIAWAAEEGRPVVAQGRRFVHEDAGAVTAVAVLARGATPEAIADAVADAAGRIDAVARRFGWVKVTLPPEGLRPLSAHPAIARLREPYYPSSKVVSEGVAAIKADAFRQRTGADGTGVSVGILDSAFQGAAERIGNELPASTEMTALVSEHLTGYDNAHGTACAEIVHDVAPGAQLILAGFEDGTSWGEALDDLIARGVKVISHSIGFDNLFPADGASPFAQAVDIVASHGIAFVTAAGNEAENYFRGPAIDADGNSFVEFSSGTELLPIFVPSESAMVVLRWDDPYGSSNHDFDLFIVTGDFAANPVVEDNPAVLASSQDVQAGEGDPLEVATLELEEGRRLFAVVRRDPASPVLAGQQLAVYTSGGIDPAFRTTAGSLSLPADARGAIAVGAVPLGSTTVESFSSRGPTADGRVKPDLAGPDGVDTASYPDPFFGTSAATPHVAGAAALLLSADPGLSGAGLRLALERATASGGSSSAKSNDVGFGVIDLDLARPGETPNPGRVVLGQADFADLEPFGAGETGPVLVVRFTTTRAGDLDVVVDWTSPSNNVDLILFQGGCEVAELGEAGCPELAAARTSAKPETVVLREASAGEYSLLLVNFGSTTESGTVTVGLVPSTTSMAQDVSSASVGGLTSIAPATARVRTGR